MHTIPPYKTLNITQKKKKKKKFPHASEERDTVLCIKISILIKYRTRIESKNVIGETCNVHMISPVKCAGQMVTSISHRVEKFSSDTCNFYSFTQIVYLH